MRAYPMEGFLLIDKPEKITSHDVVDHIRRITGIRRVGHAGTLDPFATGLLIIGVGRTATREFQHLVGLDKDYEAVFVLGAGSDTDDGTGKVVLGDEGWVFGEQALRKAMERFVGNIEQIPPTYAAIKVGGVKMYEAARAGTPIEAKPRKIQIREFTLMNHETGNMEQKNQWPSLFHDSCRMIHVKISCSSGTYIRALARDLGQALGTLGYVEKLRRTRIGPFSLKEAVSLEHLEASNWSEHLLSTDSVLARVTSETLTH